MKKALKPDEQDIWINKYLRGELTEVEGQDFEQQLEGDDALRQRVEAMKEIQAGIRQSVLNEKRELMGKWDSELDEEESSSVVTGSQDDSSVDSEESVHSLQSPVTSQDGGSDESKVVNMKAKGRPNRWLLVWLSTAAVMVLVAVMVWPSEVKLSPKYAYILENSFDSLIIHETLRSSDFKDPYTKEQREAYEYFYGQNFKKAIPLLKGLWEEEMDSIALYYWGYGLIFTGKEEEGEKLIN